ITQDRLIKTINQWTGHDCPASALESINISFKKNSNQLSFDADLALYHANKSAGLAIDMFNLLLESMAADISNIMAAWEEEDIGALLELVHKMHGASRYCGALNLRNILEELEISLKSGNSSQWPELMRTLVEVSSSLQHWA